MAPAPGTLLIRRLRHRSARFFRLMNRQITDDEKLFQLFLWDVFCALRVRIQNHSGFQCVANQLVLARVLNRRADNAAQSQKLLNLAAGLLSAIVWDWKSLEVNRAI